MQVQGFFDIAVDNLFYHSAFAEHYINKGLPGPDVVVVSPKTLVSKRARSLAEYLDAPIAIIDYEQDDANRDYGYNIGDVKDKKAILIDDILNTGKTFSEAAKIVEREGATGNLCCIKSWFICKGAVELLDQAPIKRNLSNRFCCSKRTNT